jgi:hypothetical protein
VFPLDMKTAARYFLIWITDPGPFHVAHVNEVRVR